MSQRSEVVLGVLASALAVAGLACAVFAPAVFTYPAGQAVTAGPTSLWAHGLTTAPVLVFLGAMLVAGLGVSVGAYLRSAGEGVAALFILWVSTLVLTAGALITLPGMSTSVVPSTVATQTPDSVGIGIYLVPAVVLAIVAAIAGTVVHYAPRVPTRGLLRP